MSYTFSGHTVPARPWLPFLEKIRDNITATTGYDFNFVLVNRYSSFDWCSFRLVRFVRLSPGFLDLHLSVSNGFVSSKIYDKRDDFDFDKVNFPFLDGDVPRRPSYGVYISQLIRFA